MPTKHHNLAMRYPEGKMLALTLSYDDGIEADIRLIDIMRKNGLKGTFNLNSALLAQEKGESHHHRRLTAEEALALYDGETAEVAIHGAYHPFWTSLPQNVCQADISSDRQALEKLFGRIVRGGAYPYGNYSDMTVECLKSAGIAYCRTTVSTKNFAMPTDWLRMPATCHHSDSALFELADRFLEAQTGLSKRPLLFYLWGHSYEFGDNNNWDVIERFAEKMGGRGNIWYATNIEIFDYAHAYSELLFSSDMTFVQNPTATDLFFVLDGKEYAVFAGKTLSL